MYEPKLTVNSAEEVKAILGDDFPSQVGCEGDRSCR